MVTPRRRWSVAALGVGGKPVLVQRESGEFVGQFGPLRAIIARAGGDECRLKQVDTLIVFADQSLTSIRDVASDPCAPMINTHIRHSRIGDGSDVRSAQLWRERVLPSQVLTGDRRSKRFFFEKKNQKTFVPLARVEGNAATARPKVFCFFSSEKKALPCLPDVPDTWDLLCLTTEVHHTVAESAAFGEACCLAGDSELGISVTWCTVNRTTCMRPLGRR